MYAVIKTGGKQFKVAEGDTLKVEKLSTDVGKTLSLNSVLTLVDGDKVTIGKPMVKGASIDATVLSHGKGDKIRIFKMNRRKGYRKSQGHRQRFTELKINKIEVK
ncbi:MAG: 50S ribosomal protein L21 [Nitrosomonadales bacterium]|nr:50S ribosomal protein L21 [Nitrosomonadales bacterium]|tara:strand:+ start:763 stop:1077 length:315 start_codon:yes stop_codon:yes gene_type:complete